MTEGREKRVEYSLNRTNTFKKEQFQNYILNNEITNLQPEYNKYIHI